jgi:hypothetical protein
MWLDPIDQVVIGILGGEATSGLCATRVDLQAPAQAADIIVPLNDYRVALINAGLAWLDSVARGHADVAFMKSVRLGTGQL